MAGQNGEGEDFAKRERKRKRVPVKAAQHSEGPLFQVSVCIIGIQTLSTCQLRQQILNVRHACPFLFKCRLEQEKAALQKKLKARGVTADQVVGVRFTELEKETEELKKKNSELETELASIKYACIFSKALSTVQTVFITVCKASVTTAPYVARRWPA